MLSWIVHQVVLNMGGFLFGQIGAAFQEESGNSSITAKSGSSCQ